MQFSSTSEPAATQRGPFVDRRVGGAQRALIFRLRRSAELVIPGTVATTLPWDHLLKRSFNSKGPRPSPFQVMSHAIAQLAQVHPRFRSVMLGDDRVREFDDVNVGIAISRPNDELIITLIRNASSLSLSEYVRACATRMREAIGTGDQAADDMQILVSHLGEPAIEEAIPSLVAPASAVFFSGGAQS